MTNLDMSEAIRLLAQEKGLSEDSLLHVLVDALASAYKRRPGAADEVVVEVDPQTMEFTFTAYDLDEDGNWVNERDDTPKRDELGRIAAQTFRQVMSQRIREVERDRKFEEYANREGDIVTGIIQQTDTRYTLLDLGRVEALLPQAEQVPFERPQPGDRCKAYIVEVRRTAKGPQIVVSRTHPGLIKRLFELEVPEIADGIVEIKACAREPGHRTKLAVWSNDHNVDPVGACVGARGGRVRMVVNELRGEKIDIVPFSDDLADFVAKALSPAKVSQVLISDDTTQADVIVPDHQLVWPSVGRDRTPAWRLGSPECASTSAPRPSSPRAYPPAATRKRSSTPRGSGSPTPRPARWSGTPPTAPSSARPSGTPRPTRRRPPKRPLPMGPGAMPSNQRRRPSRPRAARPTPSEAETETGETETGETETEAETRRPRRTPRPARRRRRSPRTHRASGLTKSDANPPVRTCVGCRLRRPQQDLVRCVLTAAGEPAVSRTAPGRGAWLCVPPMACFELAVRRKAFDRAWRRPVGADALAELRSRLESAVRVGRDDEKG